MLEENNLPLVSVVIPCYNHEQFVQDSIQSVIDQSYQNIELIIIDDGSKDSSVEMIQKMIEKCVNRFTRFEFRTRPNKGLSTTLNEALEWCQGEYYSAIASDDMMLKDKTEKQVDYLNKNTEILGVFGNVIYIDQDRNITGKTDRAEKKYSFDELFFKENSLTAPTQMLRLKDVRRVGYKDGFILEDWYIYLKLSEFGGDFLYLKDHLCYYRKHGANISDNKFKISLGGFQVMNEFLYLKNIDDKYIQESCSMMLSSLRLDLFKTFKVFCTMLLTIIFRK